MTIRQSDIVRVPLYQQVHDFILDQIKNGLLKPGDPVDVQTFADVLGVSRTPVREAVRQLIKSGILVEGDNARARVYLPSASDLAEIYQVRAAMYSVAAESVARAGRDLDLRSLRGTVPDAAAVECIPPSDAAGANERFHVELVRLSENAVMERLQETMSLMVRQYRHLAMQYPERRSGSVSEHSDILHAIVEGESDRARELMYRHILNAGAWAIAHLAPNPSEDTLAMRFLRESGSLT